MNQIALVFLILFCFSCDQNKYIRKYKLPKISSANILVSDSNKEKSNLIFKWTAPNDWVISNNGSMRIGSYNVPFNNNQYADLSITYFKGDGGGLMQNINRWRGQLNLKELSLDEIKDAAVYGNSSIGSYKMFEIVDTLNTSRAFLCFIISTDSSTIFLKLDSSFEGINTLENNIKNFVATFKYTR